MKRDGKFGVALHVLAHLAAVPARPLVSAELADCLRTNPVVIRRSLAVLREAGIVTSAKGHGGGWLLARPAAEISLGEVYVALGEQVVSAPVRAHGRSGCPIGTLVDQALNGFYAEAEALLLRRFDGISLADLAADFHRWLAEQTASPHLARDDHHHHDADRATAVALPPQRSDS